ncbi:FadR/GntR family transcriptional regulator [Populibacterium corticicola]|uniref:FadR/GntR family transcriptional regulator n=1 Tax=Populibacterium corticicola TaxID=1812826 RepID=A0ABW5XJ16_9MICO
MSSSLHDRVLQTLGREIIDGTLPPGTVMIAEDLESRFRVSRSVIREAIRVLESIGLVASIKRVGTRVQPKSRWNALDPQLIRWRLASQEQGAQLRSLTELRASVEPSAARLAATHAPEEIAVLLLELVAQMRNAATAGDRVTFTELDIEFHRHVLRCSGNDMFASLDSAIAEVIRGRTEHGMMPKHPSQATLARHEGVARAIAQHQPDLAQDTMAQIMDRTTEELSSVWADSPRTFS